MLSQCKKQTNKQQQQQQRKNNKTKQNKQTNRNINQVLLQQALPLIPLKRCKCSYYANVFHLSFRKTMLKWPSVIPYNYYML